MYKVIISKMYMGYYLSVEENNGNIYFNEDIGRLAGIDYKKFALDNNGFVKISSEDLDGNDIEEVWFERYGDIKRVKGLIEVIIGNK